MKTLDRVKVVKHLFVLGAMTLSLPLTAIAGEGRSGPILSGEAIPIKNIRSFDPQNLLKVTYDCAKAEAETLANGIIPRMGKVGPSKPMRIGANGYLEFTPTNELTKEQKADMVLWENDYPTWLKKYEAELRLSQLSPANDFGIKLKPVRDPYAKPEAAKFIQGLSNIPLNFFYYGQNAKGQTMVVELNFGSVAWFALDNFNKILVTREGPYLGAEDLRIVVKIKKSPDSDPKEDQENTLIAPNGIPGLLAKMGISQPKYDDLGNLLSGSKEITQVYIRRPNDLAPNVRLMAVRTGTEFTAEEAYAPTNIRFNSTRYYNCLKSGVVNVR